MLRPIKIITTFLLSIFTVSFVYSETNRTDWDIDDDGLIEINDFEDLNSIRDFLDGTGLHGSTRLCFSANDNDRTCNGFELTSDIDFDTNQDGTISSLDESWNDGKGWQPILSFSATVNGNGHFIKNLYSQNNGDTGLFIYLRNAQVYNLGFTGPLSNVGFSFGTGPLAREAHNSVISGIYSDLNISGLFYAGGIVAYAKDTTFEAIEVHGTVSAFSAAGIVPKLEGSLSSIKNSLVLAKINEHAPLFSNHSTGEKYSMGAAITHGDEDNPPVVENTYWSIELTGIPAASQPYGQGILTHELSCLNDQSVCSPTLYSAWTSSVNPDQQQYWQFISGQTFPQLLSLSNTSYLDSDGDFVIDAIDQFPLTNAVSIDHDLDGLPDSWNANCDSACQALSQLSLDQFLADTDNDGDPNTTDSDDNGDGIVDIDADSDGLIEISSLAGLNNIRFNLAATGTATSITSTIDRSGCPITFHTGIPIQSCSGHELTQSLDFDTNSDGVVDDQDLYWNQGQGWEPVGISPFYVSGIYASMSGVREGLMAYTGTFYGNGHQIKNLMINRPDRDSVGLFGAMLNLISQPNILNVGLTGPNASIIGKKQVGAFSGQNAYVFESYSTVDVSGEDDVGGLSGFGGSCYASLSTGNVSGQDSIGGLIGDATSNSEITACFSTGAITSRTSAGGLFGGFSPNHSAKIYASYSIAPAIGFSIMENSYAVEPYLASSTVDVPLEDLQCPTFPGDPDCYVASQPALFHTWANYQDNNGYDYWNFGSENELPGLSINGEVYRDANGDGVLDQPVGIEN